MSRWRREASERLPELQSMIASREIDDPMMLWIELNLFFEKQCALTQPPLDLLQRIWQYSDWCLKEGSDDVATSAAVAFCEHLLDTPARIQLLPEIISRQDFLSLKNLLVYHNTPEAIESYYCQLWGKS